MLPSPFYSFSHTYFAQAQYISMLYFMCIFPSTSTKSSNYNFLLCFLWNGNHKSFKHEISKKDQREDVWKQNIGPVSIAFFWIKNQNIKNKTVPVGEEDSLDSQCFAFFTCFCSRWSYGTTCSGSRRMWATHKDNTILLLRYPFSFCIFKWSFLF